jgi:hypothetical protein
VALKYFNVKQGLTTGNVLVSDGNVTLGNIANVHILGGSSGQAIITDGAGNLSFGSAQSPAPMPYIVFSDETLTIPEYYQGLYSMPITVDGTIVINGYLVEV